MHTLGKLYLGSEPTGVNVADDQLVLTLADGRTLSMTLEVVSQLVQTELVPAHAEILILRQPPQIDHVHISGSALNVYLKDGRLLSCPLAWFPRLLHGASAERNHYKLSSDDNIIH